MKPVPEKSAAPKVARVTPATMMETLASWRRLGGARRKAQVARRVAAALVDWGGCWVSGGRGGVGWRWGAYFHHLDEGDAEEEVGHVAADEGDGVDDGDGDDGFEVEAAGHGDFVPRV